MPVRPMCSHLAPVGQPPRRHVNAQYLSPLEESWSTHWGVAVVPAGTSVGHVFPLHFGVQVDFVRPAWWMFVVSASWGRWTWWTWWTWRSW